MSIILMYTSIKTAEKSNHAIKSLLDKETNRSINQMSKAKPGLFILCLHRLEIKKTDCAQQMIEHSKGKKFKLPNGLHV